MFKTKLYVTALMALLSSSLQALPQDWQQEMVIQSDRAELDRKTGMVVYEGDVVLTQGTLKIESERLVLMLDGKNLQQAIAEGAPARYEQQVSADKPVTHATAKRIDYFARDRQITFKGDAELRQESNLFSGELIRYDITRETVTASGGDEAGSNNTSSTSDDKQRIRVVIQPQQSEQAPAQPAAEESASKGTAVENSAEGNAQ
ncbi:lipopolysaccharide transport periplasmic protein LptA [Oceanobacter mangrovi]|uniref:lipopolysaccharide transport periplasmic protein LptA n=1 Tax=Oceanobacter mangrovi TaxID=2862510 RepID=UPI001C8DF100|nr:lipopolysaccharide transport periplasmic protein LptA [Oceanobacter mangrovi]